MANSADCGILVADVLLLEFHSKSAISVLAQAVVQEEVTIYIISDAYLLC